MKKAITGVRRFVGLDVHADTISAAMAEREAAVRDMGSIPNREESVRKLAKKLTEGGAWAACYEAGPTGYALYWQLTKLGIPCVVIAPTLVPTKAGDRVKTDRRGARRLASSFRAGELTPVWVPDAPMKRCATWCARGRLPSKISCGHAIGWGNIFCDMENGPRSTCAPGGKTTLSGSKGRWSSISAANK